MSHLTYKIVEHDGGWAYTVDGVFSEPFPTHAAALATARRVANEQRVPGRTEVIEYETADGKSAHRNRGRQRPPGNGCRGQGVGTPERAFSMAAS